MHDGRNSVQCGGTTWPTGAIVPLAETYTTGFAAKNELIGLLLATLFVSHQHVQLHPREIPMSKLPGGKGICCPGKVEAARMKAPKLQRNKNEWEICFFIRLFQFLAIVASVDSANPGKPAHCDQKAKGHKLTRTTKLSW
jgi:hypothetical protein